MKKVIINENSGLQEAELRKVNVYITALNDGLEEFQAETGFMPTLSQVKSRELLVQGLDQFLELQLNAQGVVGKIMRNNIKQGHEPVADDFILKVRTLQSHPGARYLPLLQMEDGKVYLPESAELEIRDKFRVFLSSEEAKDLYQKHIDMASQFTAFSKFLNTRIPPGTYFSIAMLAQTYFSYDSITGVISPKELNYDLIMKENPLLNREAANG